VALIAEYEQGPKGGPALKAYRCPAGVWTIGWGETDGVRPGDRCTREEADRWLLEDLTERAERVRQACTIAPSPAELGAMVSLAYNIGFGAPPKKPGFLTSTVLRQHNAGHGQAASRAFGLWNKATVNGQLQVLNGLTARRAREAALYLTPDDDEAPARMPQAVEAESKLTASPINKGGIAAAGTGVIAVVAEASTSIGGLSEPLGKARALMIDVLGVPPDWILPLVLVAVGAAVIYWRSRQRAEGWA
jgi:lysozyme